MVSKVEAERRKELSREAGVTRPPRSTVASRGPTHRVAHACFTCRRAFKIADNPLQESTEARCPGCGGALNWMGRSFRTSKATDVAEWKKIETLWNQGFRFHSFRSYPDAERLPETLGEVADFVRRNPNHPFRIRAARPEAD
jgi:DNA-directed RNA polymerase subunit RPC12/RpoP